MIVLAKFEPKFFIELYKYLKVRAVAFVCEDGNVCATESAAKRISKIKSKTATFNNENIKTLRYTRIDLVTYPFKSKDHNQNVATLRALFEENERKALDEEYKERYAEVIPSPLNMSDEEVLKEILSDETSENKVNEDITIGEEKFSHSLVVTAIRETVNPKLHARTGIEKTQDAINEMTDEERQTVLNYLTNQENK